MPPFSPLSIADPNIHATEFRIETREEEPMASEWWWAAESVQERRRVVRSAPDRQTLGGRSHLHGYGEIGPGEAGHGHADRGINEWMIEWGAKQRKRKGRERVVSVEN